MAVLSAIHPTLLDLAKAQDPDGKIAAVAEILAQTNEILTDMSWQEGNLPTGHKSTVRTGYPTPTWRKMYGGIQPTKGTTAQVTDSCGMLEAMAEVDKALADLNGNTAAFRLLEDRAHLEGMNNEMSQTLFYGNESTEPEAFTGLSPRFNSTSASNGENVILGGGAGSDNTSIWLVVWGPMTCFGIVPKGSQAGLQHTDYGETVAENIDGSNGRAVIYRTHYRWDAGLVVKDWRYIVRIANIDKSLLTFDASTGANLPNLMFQAYERIPNISMGNAVWYMARDTLTTLRQQSADRVKQSTLTIENVGGAMVSAFNGVPIRRCDALAADEALVS